MALVLILALLLPGGGRGAQMRTVELEGRWYTFWDLPLPWDSADEVCVRSGMRLMAVADEELVQFVAKETAGSAWATWLGGRRGGPETADAGGEPWQWTASLDTVTTAPNEWVDVAPPDHCLALAHTPPHLAALADLPCSTALPFVCERADAGSPNFVESLRLPDRTVTILESRSTYEEAEKVCAAFNGWLATANKPDLQKTIFNVTKKLDGAWLGGQQDEGGVMRWVSTDQPVDLLGERSLLLFEEDSELVVTHDEVTLKKSKRAAAQRGKSDGRKCLLVNRKGEFKDVDCGTRRSFICETRSKSYFPITTEQLINKKRIKVSTHPYTWEAAKNACGAYKGYFFNLRDMKEVNILAKLPQEFQDLWVDGRRSGSKWMDAKGQEIPESQDESGYPPWASGVTHRAGHDCLSVYRQSLTEVLYVARNCEEKHGFVCVKDMP